jgi:GntR family transcriptional regulator
LTKENLEKEQLCVILNEEYGLQRKRVDETLESVSASSEEAKLLNTKKDRPLLLLRDVIYSSDGLPFEYTKVIFKGDKIKIKLTYES